MLRSRGKAIRNFEPRLTCPSCGAEDTQEYHREPYLGGALESYLSRYYAINGDQIRAAGIVEGDDYALANCNHCALLFQIYCPKPHLAQIIYSSWIGGGARDNSSIGDNEPPPYSFAGAKHYISEALKITALCRRIQRNDSRRKKSLDYGLGKGGFAAALLAIGWDSHGFDFANDRQAMGAANGIKMLNEEGISTSKFDFINTEQVFEHLPYPGKTFRLLVESLVPGGLIKVSVPHSRWVERGDLQIDWAADRYAAKSPMPLSPIEHLQYFRRPSLQYLAQSHEVSRVYISAKDHLNYSIEWTRLSMITKNVGRIVAFDRYRNYFIFQRRRSSV